AADQLALSYHRSFGTPVTILRPFNTFGPRQSARAVIPTVLYQLILGKNRIQLGRLDTRRDFTFVTDTARGFIAAAIPGLEGETIQLGTGHTISIADVFSEACRILNVRDATIETDSRRLRPDPSEVVVLQSNPSLAKEKLGWAHTVTFADGLARTAEW